MLHHRFLALFPEKTKTVSSRAKSSRSRLLIISRGVLMSTQYRMCVGYGVCSGIVCTEHSRHILSGKQPGVETDLSDQKNGTTSAENDGTCAPFPIIRDPELSLPYAYRDRYY